jgi:uncharacterized membrane protein YfcA
MLESPTQKETAQIFVLTGARVMIDLDYSLAGALTGFVVGLTGVGGGALMTPILLLVFGVAPATAVATDLWFAALTKVAAAAVHQRAGQIDWQVARRLWAGSLPVAVATVMAVSLGAQVTQLSWLGRAIGLVVLLTALGLLLAPRLKELASGRQLADADGLARRQPALTVAAGAVLGLCVALTSVGAGALGSLALLFIYPVRMNPHRLVATDIVHAIPLAVVAGSGYLLAGLVDVRMLASMLVGSIPATVLGSLVATHSKPRRLQVALAVVLLAVSAKLVT